MTSGKLSKSNANYEEIPHSYRKSETSIIFIDIIKLDEVNEDKIYILAVLLI